MRVHVFSWVFTHSHGCPRILMGVHVFSSTRPHLLYTPHDQCRRWRHRGSPYRGDGKSVYRRSSLSERSFRSKLNTHTRVSTPLGLPFFVFVFVRCGTTKGRHELLHRTPRPHGGKVGGGCLVPDGYSRPCHCRGVARRRPGDVELESPLRLPPPDTFDPCLPPDLITGAPFPGPKRNRTYRTQSHGPFLSGRRAADKAYSGEYVRGVGGEWAGSVCRPELGARLPCRDWHSIPRV